LLLSSSLLDDPRGWRWNRRKFMLELAKLSSVGMVRPAAVREEVDGRREEGEGVEALAVRRHGVVAEAEDGVEARHYCLRWRWHSLD
jgi:hypothetical protein